MAILHLQLEIDSEVSPELHAVLSTIGLSLPRAERLRQLASAGLIWEHLRLQALAGLAGTPHLPALTEAQRQPLAAQPTPLSAPAAIPSAAPAPPRREPLRERRVAQPAAASPTAPARRREDAAAAAAEPIALDDLPAPPPLAAQAPPLLNLPVLDDVVEDADAPTLQAAAAPRPARSRGPAVPDLSDDAALPPPAKPAPARRGEAAKAAARSAAEIGGDGISHDAADDATADAIADSTANATEAGDAEPQAPARKSRSRLARMQEKGLFKNG